jgi:hypothetical protein
VDGDRRYKLFATFQKQRQPAISNHYRKASCFPSWACGEAMRSMMGHLNRLQIAPFTDEKWMD